MKDKILYLILGILIGAVITAGCFLIFSKNERSGMRGERHNFEDMQFPEDGNFVKPDNMTDGENPPEKPSENNDQVDN